MQDQVLTEVEKLLQPILTNRNLTLEELAYVKEGKDNFLRVSIDKSGGVDLEECSIVSEILSEKLDETDLIKGFYYLDVSSPGAERPLKNQQDFINNIGKHVFVTLYVHIDGEKEFEGTLLDFTDNVATIEYKFKHTKKQVSIPYDKVAKARLAVML